jgi:hypothetical protein
MSNDEYQQQQFWEDKPIEINIKDLSSWDIQGVEYIKINNNAN